MKAVVILGAGASADFGIPTLGGMFKDASVLQEPQWSHFILRLLDADFVLVIGYSLPDLDFQARSKILTGFQANERAKWLVVDPSDAALRKYRRLLGRNRVTLYDSTLNAFNNDLDSNMEQGLSDYFF